jgi:hypothetical protein
MIFFKTDKTQMPDQKRMRTTTLLIEKPTDYSVLEKQFRLTYYELPQSFGRDRNKKKYERLHIQIKDQLNEPYKTFDYARIDGQVKKIIYVLYRRGEGQDEAVEPQILTYANQCLHMISVLIRYRSTF